MFDESESCPVDIVQSTSGFCPLALGSLPCSTHNAALHCWKKSPKPDSLDDKGWGWRGGWMHAVPHSEGMAQHTRQRPLDAGWFWSAELGAGLVLILCNFEDGAFEVMHELHSFPASSWFVFCCFLASFSLSSCSADVFSYKQHKLHVWSEGIFQGYVLKLLLWSRSLWHSRLNYISQSYCWASASSRLSGHPSFPERVERRLLEVQNSLL